MGKITKEELLDVKNIKLLREIKGAFDNKVELELLSKYIRESANILHENKELISFCQIEESAVFGCVKWYSTALLVRIIEMMKKGKIIFKKD